MGDNIISKDVLERVNNELVKAILDTPDYVRKVLTELMNEKGPSNSLAYDHPDRNKPLFERMLSAEMRIMLQESARKILREQYADEIEQLTRETIMQQEKVEGTLAFGFAKMLSQDYNVNVLVTFQVDTSR